MPSLSASIFDFATGIAIADKIDVVTSKHAARLMKSRRRIGRPSFGYPRFAVPGECFETPDCSQECYCRLDRRDSASAFRRRLLQTSREQIAALHRRPCLPVRRNSCTATCILACEGDAKAAALCERPSHFSGRNPYSRHKRSVAATTSERSRTSKS
jgi:hypothetical protein